jgi:hypothetical protein
LRGSRDSKSDLSDDPEGVTLAELRGSKSSSRQSWLTMWTEPFTQAILNAQLEQASRKMFGGQEGSAAPATQPAPPVHFREVTVIRSTKEQAVQVEMSREPVQQNLAKPDVEQAIPGGN